MTSNIGTRKLKEFGSGVGFSIMDIIKSAEKVDSCREVHISLFKS